MRNVKTFHFLTFLALLGAAQASALYCVSDPIVETFHLEKISSVNMNDVKAYGGSIKLASTYSGGVLRSEANEIITMVAGKSVGARMSSTYSYAANGKLSAVDSTVGSTYFRPVTSHEGYEYDNQDRLVRVASNKGPGTPVVTQATCTYDSSTILEKVPANDGMRAKSIEYTLDVEGRVARYSRTLEGYERDTDITTITYRDGKIVRRENRIEDTLYPIKVTVTDYNDAGLPVKELESTYDEFMELDYQSTRTFEYVMDTSGNWVQRREYEGGGATKKLNSTATRVIVYVGK